jgi:signal transduction histidine kinase
VRTLYLRIYLTLIGVLLLFALLAGWLAHRQVEQERERGEQAQLERLEGLAELLQQSLPGLDAPDEEQQRALLRWSMRLRMPLALQAADGRRIATNQRFERREERGDPVVRLAMSDGRVLLAMLPARGGPPPGLPPWAPKTGWPILAMLFVALFLGVALGAWPVVRRLTRRLEALRSGVERFGAGELGHRVEVDGKDEVAQLASSFNATATRIESLLKSNQSLLANASHELRSPLARLKMALAMKTEAPNPKLDQEVARNLQELDALVDEVLLASRLDAGAQPLTRLPLDAVALAAELAAQHEVELAVDGATPALHADERLLRRALRNLLENARRYGQAGLLLQLRANEGELQFRMLDRGPGVPPELRERLFEPFYRLPGHAEMAGGVGLGLSLVRQIALAHGGRAFVENREGGGSAFVLALPTG